MGLLGWGVCLGVARLKGECGIPYERRLIMPGSLPWRKGKGGGDAPWYSFDFGPVHLTQMSTEHAFHPGSTQHAFVMADLASVNRTNTPWLIVGFHRPFYIDSTFDGPANSDQQVARDLRAAFEDAFIAHGVDMTWSGHHHSYQRTCPVIRGECVGDGVKAPVHVVLGHAGACLTDNLKEETPAIFDEVVVKHGYTRVVATRKYLGMESFAFETEGDGDGEIIDKFELHK